MSRSNSDASSGGGGGGGGGAGDNNSPIALGVSLGVGIPAVLVALLAWWFPRHRHVFITKDAPVKTTGEATATAEGRESGAAGAEMGGATPGIAVGPDMGKLVR